MAKKISLREFQESVTARLRDASTTTTVASKLGILAGAERWLVNLSDISEAIPVPALAHVPLARTWFLGVANVRGNLFSCVDFAAFLGGDPVNINMDARLLLANAKFQVNSGLVVKRVVGLRNPELFQPRQKQGDVPWVAGEFTDAEGNVWKELDMRELLAHPDFLQAGL